MSTVMAAAIEAVLEGDEAPAVAAVTREQFIHAVRELAAAQLDVESARRVLHAKLVYGVGSQGGARGVCYYGAWQNGQPEAVEVIEVCAQAEESLTQLAGTTIHECGHVLAGAGQGHGREWKAACKRLGLVAVEAAGQAYTPAHFQPALWAAIEQLPRPTDGTPVFRTRSGQPAAPRPCPLGIGTRGGTSRGVGSGSRLRLWECGCEKPVKVRVASDDFEATCKRCGEDFRHVPAKA